MKLASCTKDVDLFDIFGQVCGHLRQNTLHHVVQVNQLTGHSNWSF